MLRKIIVFSFLVLFYFPFWASAQSATIDSLSQVLPKTSGHERIDVLNALIYEYLCDDQPKVRILNSELVELMRNDVYPMGELTRLQNYGMYQYCEGDTDSSIYYYKQAGVHGAQHGFYSEAGRVFSNVGAIYRMKGEYDSCLHYLNLSLDFSEMTDDHVLIGGVNIGLGIFHQHKGNLDSALMYYNDAREIAEEYEELRLGLSAKQNIATVYYDHFPERLNRAMFLETLALARQIGDTRNELSALEFLAGISADSSLFEEALDYYEEALLINKKAKDYTVEVLLHMGMATTYSKLGDLTMAIKMANEGLKIAIDNGVEAELVNLYSDLESYYYTSGQYDLAVAYGQKAIDSSGEDQEGLLVGAYQVLAQSYAALGAYQLAYDSQTKYSQLSESVLDEQKSKQFTEMETKYETEKKEAAIALLSQKSEIQSLEIKQKNQGITIAISVLIFVAVLVFLLYRQNTMKKERAQTSLEQRFLRSQLNPHFIFNALMAIQSYMMKNSAEQAANYLSKFARLMRVILENSREEFITVESEVEMLNNYLDIHQLRLAGSFDYNVTVDEEIDQGLDTIPPMFVQPFVENAIEHGIVTANGQGKISVSLKKSGNYITIEVVDNGSGLSNKGTTSSDHRSLASTIIQERMGLFNQSLKDKIKLVLNEIKNESGEIHGTRVELQVPFGTYV
ncbi:tetratricopeptide repeat-containing sensor histidine kinase [Reichenbachiella agariperforans]|uniref:tetratricopeptide repeat-containing sensor histidine kinase n=1 Tax=Reichenbachiella agariperforans TaxID=156994 RepID=UPI001C084709|nr:tetratricopeptide repeat protein [Reichenbachiella agariperforans]MBU2912905.1 tetratricopeptide repeat protein [Reichenbachiella agariperforans]